MRHSCFENRIGERWLDEMRLSCFENRIGESWLDEMRHSCFENRIGESWLDEMRHSCFENRNDEIGNTKQRNVQIVRGRPSVILSTRSDWFNQPSACPLIGWNLRRCSWLKLFFWWRRKQCKISFLGIFSKVRGFEFTSWCGNEFLNRQSF